ncbi:hypothetical protein G6F65_016387 [Rhizopus arrhizus]|nr:hypothetical protein G6F65_016387 [Rhizopus arrhizus]
MGGVSEELRAQLRAARRPGLFLLLQRTRRPPDLGSCARHAAAGGDLGIQRLHRGHAAGHAGRQEAQRTAVARHHAAVCGGLFGAGVLDGHHFDHPVCVGAAGLPGVRHAVGGWATGRLGGCGGRTASPGAAGVHAGVRLPGAVQPPGARQRHGSAVRRLHPHGPRQGVAGALRPVQARLAQWRAAGGDHAGPAVRQRAGRRHPRRDGLQLARAGAAGVRLCAAARLPDIAGHPAVRLAAGCGDESANRSGLPPDRSPDQDIMSQAPSVIPLPAVAATASRAPSRQSYEALRVFVRNPSAVFGVLLLAAILAVTIFGPMLMQADPFEIASAPMAPPGGEMLLGTDYLGRDVLTGMIKAHEIQGCIALENSFNKVGLDHVVL